ncbi:MAG: hypothetical protein WDO17_20185 [Alphaproteobacteria bacterium]
MPATIAILDDDHVIRLIRYTPVRAQRRGCSADLGGEHVRLRPTLRAAGGGKR